MSDRVLVACDACARSTSGRCGVHASIGVVVPPFGSPIGAPGSGMPLRTLPGPDWQAECGAAREDRDRLAREVAQLEREVEALRAAADAPPYVDCICPGCPRKVPQAWASGMCEPCCAEDCEHTDGAKAVAAERDELEAEVERLRAENERLDDEVVPRAIAWDRCGLDPVSKGCPVRQDLTAERDRLAAALQTPVVQELASGITWHGSKTDFATDLAHALRARAGEPPPTHEACNEALAGLRSMVGRQQAEVEQLRAQVGAAVGEVNKQLVKVTAFDDLRRVVHAFDARETAERNRATAQMVRDLEAAEVNHDQREAGAQAQPAGAAAAPTGQAGGAQSGSAGPPAGLSPLAAAVWRARGGPPPPHLGAGATAGYVSPAYAGVEAPGPEGGRPRYHGLCCETCGAMGPCYCPSMPAPTPTLTRTRIEREHAELLAALRRHWDCGWRGDGDLALISRCEATS